jgi:putative two-component system response regulator
MSDIQRTILVVDDAPSNIDVVKSILSESYLVQAAVNGKIALKIAEKKSPDLILLDIIMPDMDGYEVCKALKANPETANIPVIFVTGKDQESDESMGLALGAIGYVTKPVDQMELKAKVADALS